MIVSASYDTTVIVREASSGDVIKTFSYDDQAEWVMFSHDGAYLYIFVKDDGIYKKDVATWDVVTKGDAGNLSGDNVFDLSPDGSKLAVMVITPMDPITGAGGENVIQIWDADTLEVLSSLPPQRIERYFGVHWSPDGKLIAGGGRDGVIIWDAETGSVAEEIYLILGTVRSVGWSPDGRYLAAGSASNVLYVMDTESYSIIYQDPTGSTVMGVRWSPTGKYIATGTSGESHLRVYRWLGN